MSLINRGPAPTTDASPVMGEVKDFKIKNCSYAGFPLKNNEYPDADYAHYRDRAINHNCKDGVYPMTPEEQQAERDYNWQMVAKFTKSIFTMNFTTFSWPVFYSEPRSFLERTADLFTFLAQKYIPMAVEATDPDERLLHLATGIAAGFHIYMACKKPWNPVLGETFIGEYQNGAKIYAEQTSHHPPISDFELFGPNGEWHCYGHCKFTIASGMREVDINQTGVFHLEFKDGAAYEWEFPMIQVWGIVYGDRIIGVKGPVVITDLKNNLKCRIETYPRKDTSKGITESKATTTFAFTFKADDTKETLRKKFNGDYCQKFFDGDKVYWDINTDIVPRPKPEAPEELLLPSDCRYRIDRSLLITKELDDADKGKVIVEESQRREEKMRVCIPLPQ